MRFWFTLGLLTSVASGPANSGLAATCSAAEHLRTNAASYAAFAASHATELLTPLGTGDRRGANYRQLCDLAIVDHRYHITTTTDH